MRVFIVAYDLQQPVQNYPALWAELKRLGAQRVLASDWALKLNNTATEVANHFRQYIDANDRLLVTQPSDWAAYNLMIDLASKQRSA